MKDLFKNKELLKIAFRLMAIMAIVLPNEVQSKTYALIIGVADYQDDNIGDLKYSVNDAVEFYKYLISPAGGSVDSTNIKLLLNDEATVGNIYAAKRWIEKRAKKDDMVYFYFSGHGDVEDSRYKLGFLLAHDSPHKNYLNNAVRIEDFNIMANTLSLEKKANVVLITDACKSGKLTGLDDVGKKFLLQEELMKIQQKEVRMASCLPDQLSQENTVWGGGRGAFSYFLINGMAGMADVNNNNEVTLKELKSYLTKSLKEEMDKYRLKKQTPVFDGFDNLPMASTNDSIKRVVKSLVEANTSQLSAIQTRSIDADITFDFQESSKDLAFKRLKEGVYYDNQLVTFENLDEYISFDDTLEHNLLEIVDMVDKLVFESYDVAYFDSVSNEVVVEQRIDTSYLLGSLYDELEVNDDLREEFQYEFAAKIHDYVQNVINLYLEGDEAELEKRRYYNYYKGGYDHIVPLIDFAMQMIEPDDPLYHIFEVKKYYFGGVNARIGVLYAENQDSILDYALKMQEEAIALEPNAAYINNELGIIHLFKSNVEKAEFYFKEAISLSENWAIPWSNLCLIYNRTNRLEDANSACSVADSLQPNLQSVQINIGRTNYLDKNYLNAEEYFRSAIEINDRHFSPYDHLGRTYLDITEYRLADSFFYEADIRKKGLNLGTINSMDVDGDGVLDLLDFKNCEYDTSIIAASDYTAYFYLGLLAYWQGDYPTAERRLRQVITINQDDPLAFHYLGKAYYDQGKWKEAELMFKYAKEYFHPDIESTIQGEKGKYTYYHECFELYYILAAYDEVHNYFFMGNIYEKWSHNEEAEKEYDKIIETLRFKKQARFAFNKKWSLLERFGRWEEAEQTIIFLDQYYKTSRTAEASSQQNYDRSFDHFNRFSNKELYAFYQRAIDANPNAGIWPYKLGLFLYDHIDIRSPHRFMDSIIVVAATKETIFFDTENYNASIGKTISPWELGNIELSNPRLDIGIDSLFYFPGTKEVAFFAKRIDNPRKDAIKYLEMALLHYFDDITTSDLNFKIGNVYVRAGSHKLAWAYYEKAVNIMPKDAGYRLKAIASSRYLFKNRITYSHLLTLEQDSTINYPLTMLLGKYAIYNKDYKKGEAIVHQASKFYPYYPRESKDILGRSHLINERYEEALTLYEDLLANEGSTKSDVLYTIARIYALMGREDEAKATLKKAMESGFNYTFVLDSDPVWEAIYGKKGWRDNVNLLFAPPVYKLSYIYP